MKEQDDGQAIHCADTTPEQAIPCDTTTTPDIHGTCDLLADMNSTED